MKFSTLPTDGRVIAGTWYPSTWPMWLARTSNLPVGCLQPHLGRILSASPVFTIHGRLGVADRLKIRVEEMNRLLRKPAPR